jgi:hypothetical protein
MKFMSILLREGRREDLKQKYSEKFEGGTGLDFILNISDLVDFNHKYTDWVLKNVNPESENFDDDVEYIVELIKDFDKYQSQFPKKDINQYVSVNELDAVVSHARKKKQEKELENQVDKIYEDDKFLVVKPKSHAASCKYGSNTRWCTTAQSDTHFKQYTSGNQVLYYIINKANSTNKNYSKVAIHFDNSGSKRYWDSQDSPMNDREIEIFNYAFPEIIEKIKEDYKKIEGSFLDTYLKQVFNSKGISNKKTRKFLGTDKSLNVRVEGFETINDLGPGHANGLLSIFLDNELIDSYQVFITYRPLSKNNFSASIGFMGNDPTEEQDYVDTNLEGWGFDPQYSIGSVAPYVTSESIRNHIVHKVNDYIKDQPVLLQKLVGSARVFTPTYGYTFGKNKGWVKKLVDYLDSGKVGTKLDFLTDIKYLEKIQKDGKVQYRRTHGNHIFKPRELRGQHSSFFAAAKNAGILGYRKVGREFFLIKGPNFDAFKKGELRAL